MGEIGLIISGLSGAMGKRVSEQAQKAKGVKVIGGIDKDKDGRTVRSILDGISGDNVIVDFSLPEATSELLAFAKERGCPLVIGTTGHSEEKKEQIRLASKYIPIIMAPNFSLGVAFFIQSIIMLVKGYKELGVNIKVEIMELHHKRKKDKPSGTAKLIKERLLLELGTEMDIPIESVREGEIIGIHEVKITAGYAVHDFRNIIEDRNEFADGAIQAAKFIVGMPPGLYDMKDLIKNQIL